MYAVVTALSPSNSTLPQSMARVGGALGVATEGVFQARGSKLKVRGTGGLDYDKFSVSDFS